MEVFRHGLYRNHGNKTLVKEKPAGVSVHRDTLTGEVSFSAHTTRRSQGKPSYSYGVRLEPQLLIKALLKLRKDQLRAAINEMDDLDYLALTEMTTTLLVASQRKQTPEEPEE